MGSLGSDHGGYGHLSTPIPRRFPSRAALFYQFIRPNQLSYYG